MAMLVYQRVMDFDIFYWDKKIELNAEFSGGGDHPCRVFHCGVVDIGIISVIYLCVGTIISTIRLILEL